MSGIVYRCPICSYRDITLDDSVIGPSERGTVICIRCFHRENNYRVIVPDRLKRQIDDEHGTELYTPDAEYAGGSERVDQ